MRSSGLVVLVLALLVMGVVSGCAPGANQFAGTMGEHGVAGSWLGLWQGLIAPFVFVVLLFKNTVNIYETHNTGVLYNLGYLFGLMCIFGGGGKGAARRE